MKSFVLSSTLVLFGILLGGVGQAQTPLDYIAFQGRASTPEGDPLPDGVYASVFALYDSTDGVIFLWSETYPALSVSGGYFTVMLGSVTPFPPGIFETGAGLWLQTGIDSNGDGLDQADLHFPRTPLNSVPAAFHARNADTLAGEPASSYATLDSLVDKIDRDAESYLVVQTGDNPLTNGANLLAAYADAKTRFPYGLDLSETNRFAVIVPPGLYQLGTSSLTLDSEFIDLIGLSGVRDHQLIYGTANGPNTGVVAQTAEDVAIENLTIECTLNVGGLPLDASAACAYYPVDDLVSTRIKNCRFKANDLFARSMRVGVHYTGTYIDCDAQAQAFGSGANASGYFLRCSGGDFSFGGGAGGRAGGTFIDCVGSTSSFGGDGGSASGSFENCISLGDAFGGGGGSASGTFENCRAGADSFGGAGGMADGIYQGCRGGVNSFGGGGGEASGTFRDCHGVNFSFGGGAGGVASGQFFNCSSASDGFGGGGGTASGYFEGCSGNSGVFGGEGGMSTGEFVYCEGGGRAFGGGGGVASGVYRNCSALRDSFGGTDQPGTAAGEASGLFIDCTSGNDSFGAGPGGVASGEFRNCTAGSDSFGNAGSNADAVLIGITYGGFTNPFHGTMRDCTYTADPIVLGDGARIFNSIFYGDVDLADSTAGIAHCSVGGKIGGIDNAAFNQFNLELVDVQ